MPRAPPPAAARPRRHQLAHQRDAGAQLAGQADAGDQLVDHAEVIVEHQAEHRRIGHLADNDRREESETKEPARLEQR